MRKQCLGDKGMLVIMQHIVWQLSASQSLISETKSHGHIECLTQQICIDISYLRFIYDMMYD